MVSLGLPIQKCSNMYYSRLQLWYHHYASIGTWDTVFVPWYLCNFFSVRSSINIWFSAATTIRFSAFVWSLLLLSLIPLPNFHACITQRLQPFYCFNCSAVYSPWSPLNGRLPS
jgi:hypothetical protein